MTGSLQIKNGKYYAVINISDINGKRKQKWISSGFDVKGNKKKAEQFLRDKLKEFELQENIVPSDILFSDYVLHWLNISKIRLDPVTFQGYQCIAKSHIIPYFKQKNIKLCDIKRNDIQEYVFEKSKNGKLKNNGSLSPKTIKTHMIIIQQTLKEAVKSNMISSNPYQYISLPKMQRREPTFYTFDEIETLFDKIRNEQIFPIIYFTVLFGLRRSEVLGLKWDSIDFERNLITIKHTVVSYNKVFEKDTTKTKSSYRSFPIQDDVKHILENIKEQENINRELFGNEYYDNEYIFKWENGKLFDPDYISKKFKKLLKQNGLKEIRFHDLRHSCASLLVANGFSLKDIQEWLGHSDIQTTANIYAHLDADRKNKISISMSNSFTF